MELLTGLTFGFLGSLHCIGMCGPIALALPGGEGGGWRFAGGRLLYNAGRTVTYAVIGAAVGLIGGNILLPLLQQRLSVIVGAVLVLTALAPVAVRRLSLPVILQPLYARISAGVGRLLHKRSLAALFGLGLLNGFLPCGFVYLALAGALVSGSVAAGVLFMAGFGLGTLPAMLAVALSPGLLSSSVRARAAHLLPVLSVMIGILLIVRGLNLGIPYLSPKFNAPTAEQANPECCDEE